MAVEIDRLNRQVLDELAFREDLKPVYNAFNHLFELLRQTRDRTGGDTDLVSSTASASSTNFYAGGFYEEAQSIALFPVEETDEQIEFAKRYALLLS